ncbi:hypothetical protein [Actinophytocola sp.]|uniref:hypothetical protein n=1 Tax=Actinophytocola sp. TaxID=1872138 RepID=UPI002D713A98|nr:hypothetical protein [Actinophytocola sp.]HYQ62702.1 hypothetical protein [Actinophytocola sp.]
MSNPNDAWPQPRLVESDPPRRSMSDRLTAWVRTVVPTLWAAGVAWLIRLGLPPAVTDAVAGLVDVLVVPAALAAVYALLRWVEPRLPAWLARLLLGSTRPPSYRT